jgi:glycosyltransferase involved in cell wall biosynthesis
VATRRHATNGVGNLLGRSQPDDARTTVLLAVPYLILGGAERLLSEVMRGCRKAGFRVVVVTTIPTIPALGDTTSWFEPATDEIYHLPRFLSQCYWKDFVEYLVGAKAVSMVMLAGSTFFYDAIPDLKIRHPHLTVVDLLFNTIGHTESNRRIAASLDLTFVEGEDVHDWLTARGEQPERICLVPSGVDLDRYQPMPRPDDILAAMGLAADVFIAGFSGRLAEEKAPLAFLAIAAELPIALPVHFVMTGAGPMEEQVRAAAHRSPIAERVHFRGLVDDVRDYLACYDVLVVPSVIDGRPTVVMEALAMGIPVVASRVGSLPRLVIDGETGFLCEPGDVRGFAAKITQLHDDPVLRSRMGQAARRFAEQHFLLRTMVSRYVSTISRLVDAKRRHSPAENRGPDLERVAAVAEPSSYDLAPPVDSEPGRGDSLI